MNSGETATVLKFNSIELNNNPVEMESMLYSRQTHACTIFKSALHDNRPIIIVAGSYDYFDRSKSSNIAEVLDFTQEGTSWQESNLIFISIIFFCIFQR